MNYENYSLRLFQFLSLSRSAKTDSSSLLLAPTLKPLSFSASALPSPVSLSCKIRSSYVMLIATALEDLGRRQTLPNSMQVRHLGSTYLFQIAAYLRQKIGNLYGHRRFRQTQGIFASSSMPNVLPQHLAKLYTFKTRRPYRG